MDPNSNGSTADFSDTIDALTPLLQTGLNVYSAQQQRDALAAAGYVQGPNGQLVRMAGVAPALNVNVLLIGVLVVGAIVLLKG